MVQGISPRSSATTIHQNPCRKDTQTAIAFLTKRVRKPDKDDCNKLRRLLGYLKQTIKLPLVLRADGVNVLKYWVDASYAAHAYMW